MPVQTSGSLTRYSAAGDGRLVALHVPASFDAYADHEPHDGRRGRLTDPELPLQIVRVQGAPGDAGSKHVHLPQSPAREWSTAHKVIVCLGGRVRVDVSEADGTPVGDAVLGPGDALLCTEGHEVTYLEEASRLIEIKQGPSAASPEADRVVLD